ncbi:hypothetical protein HYFRA_00004351 [Hymenoscyphus fraxineus]|uniref:Uncharacterized protein n=1 Tax=Hymenoscyphus fraxineus TaxID=746836 RepID=A0A9N9PQ21_9HELO|nr:hypothetical protein HYFRA_00004351 [Hymenoscyphus fraxineus]
MVDVDYYPEAEAAYYSERPPSQSQPPLQIQAQSQSFRNADPKSYIFPWGKHKGKPILEVPIDYMRWLQTSSEMYRSNPVMIKAVEYAMYTASMATPSSPRPSLSTPTSYSTPASSGPNFSTPPSSQSVPSYSQPIFSQPAPSYSKLPLSQPDPSNSQPSRTPLAPRSSNHTLIAVKPEIHGPYVLDFGKHQGSKLEDVPAEYIAWLRRQPHNTEALKKAIRNWDKIPRVYRLGFGMHRGCTLDEVPPAYITWLYENAADEYDDLREALAKHKRENSIKQVTAQKSKSSKKQKKPFVCPPNYTSDYRRYYYTGDRKGQQMWIGCHDALKYFGADATAMKAAGLEVFHKGQRFWVHQVFAYARHFGTTGTDTATNALNKFKAKKYN